MPRRYRCPALWRMGMARASKTGHRGDHRLWRGVGREKLVPPEPQPGRSPSASASEPYVYKKGTPDGNNPKFATTNEHFFMRASRRRGRRGIAPAVYRKRLRNPG